MIDAAPPSRTGFWDRPAIWKALLPFVCWATLSFEVNWLFADTGTLIRFLSAIVLYALPVVLAWRLGWLRQIFGRQPVPGRWWMWIAVLLTVAESASLLMVTRWDRWAAWQLALIALTSLYVAVAEQVIALGLTVKLLRDGGHGERFVAAVSSLLCGLLAVAGGIGNQSLIDLSRTFADGFAHALCLYVVMRVTGSLWAAIAVHGLALAASRLYITGYGTVIRGGNDW